MSAVPRRWAAAAAAVVAAYACVIAWGGPAVEVAGRSVERQLIANLFALVGPVAAAASCAVTAVRRREARVAWALLSAATLAWAAGQAVWTFYEVVGWDVPFPSLADVGYLAFVPLAAAAVLAFSDGSISTAVRLRTASDGVVVAASLLLVAWVVAVRAVWSAGDGSLGAWIAAAYPTGDVAIWTVALVAAARLPRGRRGALSLVAAGLVAFALGDTAFAVATMGGWYETGSPLDLGWAVGFLLVALAARSRDADARWSEAQRGRLGSALPFAAVVAAVAATASRGPSVAAEPFVFGAGIVLVLALVARQVLVATENVALQHALASNLERVAERERHFRGLVSSSSDVVSLLGADGVVRWCSPAAARVFGWEPEGVVGEAFLGLVHPDDVEGVRRVLADVTDAKGGARSLECRLSSSGGWQDTETTVTNRLDDPHVAGLVLNSRDVSERKLLERQLAHQAFHDPLTGLANRALLMDRIEHALALARPVAAGVAVVVCDVDGFKGVNDSLGHAAGDELLVAAAHRLRTCAREHDTVARLGGDDFALLLEGLGAWDAAELTAHHIVAAFAEPFVLEGREVVVSVSVGTALGAGATTPAQVLRDADLAMYGAKARGGGRAVAFEPGMHAAALERLELEADLRRAIAGGDLQLHYQPLVRVHDGTVDGVEALVRWNHPVRGPIPPAVFVPLAEETGLVLDLGRWVLETALAQLAGWRADGTAASDLTMSVNVSPLQLADYRLVGDVTDALHRHGLDPSLVVLEITESAVVADPTAAVAQLEALRRLGVRLALDDFGTGWSSLSALRSFPLDSLKVDRAFVEGITDQPAALALVRGILTLSGALCLETVAEGVETAEQFDALRVMRCGLAQGYHLARPAPADEIAPLLRGRILANAVAAV